MDTEQTEKKDDVLQDEPAVAEKAAEKRSHATKREGSKRAEKTKRQPNPERRRRVLIILAVVVVAIAMLYRPTRDLYIAWRTGYVLESRYEALAEENEELNDDIDRLMTREGIEDEARERGYVLPGETSVKVEGLEEVETEEGSEGEEAEEEGPQLPWYIHVGDFIFFYSEDE